VLIAAVGTTVWAGVKLLKPAIGRGRPDEHLDVVKIRGKPQTGAGFPSGHAAVAMTLALAAVPPGPSRSGALALAAMTGAARIYVGAHLPLDIVGGMAIGVLGSELARTIRG